MMFDFPKPYTSAEDFMNIINNAIEEGMKKLHPYADENKLIIWEWINFKEEYDYIGRVTKHEIL